MSAIRPGILMAYDSAEVIRGATEAETLASMAAAASDGGAGVIRVDGQRCYVEGGDLDLQVLRREAAEAGDLAQVELCNRALRGEEGALYACARVVRDAARIATAVRSRDRIA